MEIHLDFEIDKLTNSIENAISGEVFDTIIIQVTDTKKVKKTDWVFNWHHEIKSQIKDVFCLTTVNNPTIIQGLISLTDKGDHIFMDLIENAKFNKGKNKLYKALLEIWLLLRAKQPLKKVMMGWFLLSPKHN